jgi:glycogen debranching enzyme
MSFTTCGTGAPHHVDQPDDFSITAQISLVEQRSRTLKNGDMFGVFDQRGDIRPGPGGTEGLYFNDTRTLSEFEFLVAGRPPVLLSSTLRDDNGTLTCDLSNPDLHEQGLAGNLIHIQRSRFLWNATCHERISIRNFDGTAHQLQVEIRYGADFADLFEIRGMTRKRHGRHEPAEVSPQDVILAYTGLDQRRRTTRLRFDPQPARIDEGRALFNIALPPHGRALIFVEITCDRPPGPRVPSETFLASMRDQRRWTRENSARAAAIETSNEVFNEAMRRAISDLTMLTTDKPTGPYPYAGIPWFSTCFGRDALITAMNVLWMDPAIARGVLMYLAENQATATDAASDAEPGKILHEVRRGEMAELGEVPFRRYYGSVDSTPLFLMLAGAYLDRTGDIATLTALWPHIQAALGWLDSYAERNPLGFISYFRQTEEGLANQGWKDSFDSISHADGTLATGPIALCEVQAYAFGARRAAASIAWRLGHIRQAEEEYEKADALRTNFEKSFWCEDLGTYALALDGAQKPCRVRASNAGQVLLTGIASPDRAARVADVLMEGRSFNGWGVRTLASGEQRYNPMSYHNGSVWPHDNALIAMGLSRYGLKAPAERIFGGLFDAALYVDLRRLPELFCGFARRRGQGPTFYPVACSPQAWAATALHATLGACLGISFNPAESSVVFDRPRLPPFLNEVTLHHLALGNARISVLLRRMGSEVAMNVLSRTGSIHAILKS